MGSVFISYRRSSSTKDARAVYERLRRELSSHQIFVDLEGIDPGEDFVSIIGSHLDGCDALVVLIGSDWIGAGSDVQTSRIEQENDFVRLEIATALRRKIKIFPVLLDGASTPLPSQLPEDLQPLLRRQTMPLDYARFDDDISRLARVLSKSLAVDAHSISAPKVPPVADAITDRPLHLDSETIQPIKSQASNLPTSRDSNHPTPALVTGRRTPIIWISIGFTVVSLILSAVTTVRLSA